MTSATVIYVAYGVTSIDLDWLPAEVPVVVVHNDDLLRDLPGGGDRVTHLHSGGNVGFGAGVNLALPAVSTRRVVLCNPDTRLAGEHYAALVDAGPREVVSVPLISSDGVPNAVVTPYWGVGAFVASALRLGRFAPRGSRLRQGMTRLLGRYGSGHRDAVDQNGGSWPLSHRWASGAVLSIPTELFRAVDGFDERYFLYYEDADLQQRMARHAPDVTVRLADVEPGRHEVGAAAISEHDRWAVARHRRDSAATYASTQSGVGWALAARIAGAGGS